MTENKPYQAKRIYVAWLQLLTGLVTLWSSLKIIWTAFFAKNKRAAIDKITRQWASSLLQPIGLTINVHNPHEQKFSNDKRIILMCNHSSLYDIPVSFLAVPGSIRMLTKKELFKIPILSMALNKGDFVSIDRQNRQQSIKDLANARKKLEQGIMLWIAPEGTRSRDGELHPFKKGGFHLAIETNAIIVPIVIKGINDILPSKTYQLTINGEVDVYIGKEFDSSEFTTEERNQYMQAVHAEMKSLLQ